jgi:hypothetical protein
LTTGQIERKKKALVAMAEKHGMDFQHPEVLAKSRELDRLIVAQMRREAAEKAS